VSHHLFKFSDDTLHEKVDGRVSIPLDMNAWIHIAEDVSDEATRVKALLRDLVAQGKVFCPLNFSNITELFKQNYESALRVGTVMEELSLNISFAVGREIYRKEIKSFLNSLVTGKKAGLSKEDIFVPVIAFVESQGSLNFPEGFPASEDKREEFTREMARQASAMKLTDILHKLKAVLPNPMFQFIPPPEYSEAWKERWDFTKGNKEKMRNEEQDYYVKQILIPELLKESAKLPDDERRKYLRYIQSLPQGKPAAAAREVIKQMPALKNAVEIMTITGFDLNRKSNLNDLFDIEMLIVPLAYSDVLVAPDKWIRHLLSTQSAVFDADTARYISNLSDFEVYLKSL
jgi:hypothetical protein